MAGSETVARLLNLARTQVGAAYRYWYPGLDWSLVQYTDPGSLPEDLFVSGASCSSMWNWCRARCGLPPVGGTPGYDGFLVGKEGFVPGAVYPVGTVLVNPNVWYDAAGGYRDDSHMVVVSTPPDHNGDQHTIGSDHADSGWGGVLPGITERRTVRECHVLFGFVSAGVMPDVGVIPFEEVPSWAGTLSPEELQGIMPKLDEGTATAYLPHLNAAMAEHHVNTPLRMAAFLAQLAHESGEFRWMEELGDGRAYEWREDLGNVRAGDGPRYKGRGPIQLKGRHNYRAAGVALGLDLETDPERALEADVAFRIAGWYWTSRDLNALADLGDFDGITYRINGGYGGRESRLVYYAAAKEILLGERHGKGTNLMFERYNLAAAPDAPEDRALAYAAGTALNGAGIPNLVLTGSENIRAASLAAYYGAVGEHACLVVGHPAHYHLDPIDQPHDVWENGIDTWRCWNPENDTSAGTLAALKDALAWISQAENAPDLPEAFDAILEAPGSRSK